MPRIRYFIELELDDLLVGRVFKGREIGAPEEFRAAESYLRNQMHQQPRALQRLQDKLPKQFAAFLLRTPETHGAISRAIEFEVDLALFEFGVFDSRGQWTEAFLRKITAARDAALARVAR